MALIAGMTGTMALPLGCDKNSGSPADAGRVIDADPNAPDADLTAPDGSTPSCDPVQGTPTLAADEIGAGLTDPVDLKSPPGDSRIFVVLKGGEIKIIKGDDNVLDTPFLDVTNLLPNQIANEQGLLGLAFHPQYAQNGRFFIFYTDANEDEVVAEGTRSSSNPDQANPTVKPLLTVPDFASNHNGGWIDFGPDGFLYVGIGDGGNADDPQGNGQKLTVLLAKILRLDVNTAGTAKPAAGNPFINDANENKKKIWAYGVRNPWRDSFDRKTGDLYIADVGQDSFEELNVQPADSTGGVNYGWNTMEAKHCFDPPTGCDQSGLTLPVHEYPQKTPPGGGGTAASITGGYVYRGCKMPGLDGTYFFADQAFKEFYSLKWDGGSGITDLKSYPQFFQYRVTTFGQDVNGEILFVDYGGDGKVYRIIPQP
jgi:glucose/arabinose dehydrogenase